MSKLKVIHKDPGYEAWKDEKVIPRANIRLILVILGGVFTLGCVCSLSLAPFLLSGMSPEPAVPTLVVLATETVAADNYNVLVIQQPPLTATPPPTDDGPDLQATLDYMVSQRPTAAPTDDGPDVQATLDYMISLRPTAAPTLAVATAEPVFCDGAMFTGHTVGELFTVTFDDKGALRLLDLPRVPGEREPISQHLLYDGYELQVTGDPVCGAWQGEPIAYFPVYSQFLGKNGWVGFGAGGDAWLEPLS